MTADLGRHIENGQLLLSHGGTFSKTALLHTNFFSTTYPDFPFVNHHWGSGIILYLLYIAFGFSGLSLAYGACLIAAFLLLFATLRRQPINPSIAALTSLFLIPLIAERTEIRPEVISYLLIAVFIFILYRYRHGQLSRKFLYILPALELLWANMHIYFIFGPFIIGAFFFEIMVAESGQRRREHLTQLGIVLGLSGLATLLTPYGLAGAIYPFTIFRNYGYLIAENQSIAFLERISFVNPNFLWYKIATVLGFVSSLLVFIRQKKKYPIALLIIATAFSVIAFLGIRSLSVYGLVLLPLLIYNFSALFEWWQSRIPQELRPMMVGLCLCILCISIGTHFSNRLPWNPGYGIGLLPGVLDSSNFVKTHNIRGPIFNNYDIGSYLVFTLFPTERPFVDNRPEAYPASFFNDVYIPAQQSNDVWHRVENEYHFNVIYFYHLDMTPWAQEFMIARITDPEWAPVYADAYTIIFLKRTAENQPVIAEYEIPKSAFSIQQ